MPVLHLDSHRECQVSLPVCLLDSQVVFPRECLLPSGERTSRPTLVILSVYVFQLIFLVCHRDSDHLLDSLELLRACLSLRDRCLLGKFVFIRRAHNGSADMTQIPYPPAAMSVSVRMAGQDAGRTVESLVLGLWLDVVDSAHGKADAYHD